MPSQYNPDQHHRRSIRLQGYDYASAGSYFITICAHQRQCLFGEITDRQMMLNELGQCVRSVWMNLPQHFRSLELDKFIVMPNHIHGILSLCTTDGRGEAFASRSGNHNVNPHANASPLREDRASLRQNKTHPPENGTQPQSIAAIIQNFKSVSTRKINRMNQSSGRTIWQRNYYEHIIRDDRALQTIRQYIQNNPFSWQEDQLHPNYSSEGLVKI